MIDNVLHQRSTWTLILKCLSFEESAYVLREIHEGIYDLHTGSKAFAAQSTRTISIVQPCTPWCYRLGNEMWLIS